MDLSSKSLNPKKLLKEDFVSNLTGSSMLEIAALLLIVPALVLLRQWSNFGSERGLASTNIFAGKMNDRETSRCKALWNYTLELTKDFVIVILPVILVFTVLAEWVYILAIILIIVLHLCISAKRPSLSTLNTEIGPQHLSSSKMSLLSYRVFMVVITSICILAVDFKIFPRRYAKTETYGTGLVFPDGSWRWIVCGGQFFSIKTGQGYHVCKLEGSSSVCKSTSIAWCRPSYFHDRCRIPGSCGGIWCSLEFLFHTSSCIYINFYNPYPSKILWNTRLGYCHSLSNEPELWIE